MLVRGENCSLAVLLFLKHISLLSRDLNSDLLWNMDGCAWSGQYHATKGTCRMAAKKMPSPHFLLVLVKTRNLRFFYAKYPWYIPWEKCHRQQMVLSLYFVITVIILPAHTCSSVTSTTKVILTFQKHPYIQYFFLPCLPICSFLLSLSFHSMDSFTNLFFKQ